MPGFILSSILKSVRRALRAVQLKDGVFLKVVGYWPMLKVIAQDFIKPEHIDTVLPLYKELVALTRQEPLCLSYELFINQKDPGNFVFVEEWPDRAALDVHCNTEHFKRLVPLIDQYQRAPGTFLLMDKFQ